MNTGHNAMIAAVLVGLLLSMSAGVRSIVPLLAVNLLAFYHVIGLPSNLTWLGDQTSLVILSVAVVLETVVHFIPAVGTGLKVIATPLAFAAGTLLMAVPFGDKHPLVQWTLALALGGGTATLTHLGVTGLRAMTAPANVATAGGFGIVWNIGELLVSVLLAMLGGICVMIGWVLGAVVVFGLLLVLAISAVKSLRHLARPQPV